MGFGGGIAGGNAMISSMTKEHKEFVEKKRAEIFADLKRFVKRNKHPMKAGEIVELVFHDERDEDDFESYCMLLIDDDPEQADVAQELMMGLFNYFPRMTLGGKSLAEKMPFYELQKMETAFQDGSELK